MMISMRRIAILFASACSFSPPAGTGADDAPADDAANDAANDAAPPDTTSGSPDLVIEAEDLTTSTMPGNVGWTLETVIEGYSSRGFMRCGQQTGGTCEVAGNVDGCAAMIYNLPITAQGTYHVHVRVIADTSSSEDTAFYGIDGGPAPDTLNFARTNMWHWRTGAKTYALDPGMHRLTIWQRESGAKIDVVAVTRSATHP